MEKLSKFGSKFFFFWNFLQFGEYNFAKRIEIFPIFSAFEITLWTEGWIARRKRKRPLSPSLCYNVWSTKHDIVSLHFVRYVAAQNAQQFSARIDTWKMEKKGCKGFSSEIDLSRSSKSKNFLKIPHKGGVESISNTHINSNFVIFKRIILREFSLVLKVWRNVENVLQE